MRKSAEDHPEHHPVRSLLSSAVRRALGRLSGKPRQWQHGAVAGTRLHCEPLEARVLLSGDLLPLPDPIDATIAVAGEAAAFDEAPGGTVRVLLDGQIDASTLDWPLASARGTSASTDSEQALDASAADDDANHTPTAAEFVTVKTASSLALDAAASNQAPVFPGGRGFVTTDVGSAYDWAYGVAIQPDGKYLVTGRSDVADKSVFSLLRYNADGSLDSTFDGDGKVTTAIGFSARSYAVAMQNGKIVAAGASDQIATSQDFALARYNSDGSLDTGFGRDGTVTTDIASNWDEASAMAVQNDGRILLAGRSVVQMSHASRTVVVRYLADGSLDPTFGDGGRVFPFFGYPTEVLCSLAVQPDGKIVAVGYGSNPASNNQALALFRLNRDGTLDSDFGGGYRFFYDFGVFNLQASVALQADGKILVFSTNGSRASLWRYDSNGSLDTSFGNWGWLATGVQVQNEGSALSIEADGRILVTGSRYRVGGHYDFALARYNSNGSPDDGFGTHGLVATAISPLTSGGSAVLAQADGKILVIGGEKNLDNADSDFALARYNPDGSLDTSFSDVGLMHDQTAVAGKALVVNIAGNLFVDADAGDTLDLSVRQVDDSALPPWLSFDAASRTLHGTPGRGDLGSTRLVVKATDRAGASASSNPFTITVVDLPNSPPTGAVTISGAAVQNQVLLARNTLADADGLGAISYQWQASADEMNWVAIAGATAGSLTLNQEQVGRKVRVIASYVDGHGRQESVASAATATVANVNDAPVVAKPIADQSASEDSAFRFIVPADTFLDVDVDDRLSYRAALATGGALPPWLHFDAATRSFSGTPGNGDVGIVTVKVTASDLAGATASTNFLLTVVNTNDAPTLARPITDQTATEDAAFRFTVPADTFVDVDVGDRLSYRATQADGSALPRWLAFDTATRRFTGTPGSEDLGTLDLEVTATDLEGASAAASFHLAIGIDPAKPRPDLTVGNFRISPAGNWSPGTLVTVMWDTINAGNSAVVRDWHERLAIRNASTHESIAVRDVVENPLDGQLVSGGSLARLLSFVWPDGTAGSGRIEFRVLLDVDRQVTENNAGGTAETNNEAIVMADNAPDLRVDSLTAPASVIGTVPIVVAWTAANQGTLDIAADWNDQIVYSSDSLIGNADDVVLTTVRHSGGLHVGERYQRSATVALPLQSAGHYLLGIRADSGGELFEPDARANNSASRPLDVVAPYSDLQPTGIEVPEAATSGDNVTISWQVANRGNATTNRPLWNDRLLLSRDQTPSSDDLVVAGSLLHTGALAAGESYSGRATITLPRDLSGDYFVIVTSNSDRSLDEAGLTANNSLAGNSALRVRLKPTPDLQVGEIVAPSLLRPGDAATLHYTLINQGSAATDGAWRDRIYIDRGDQGGLYEVANVLNTGRLDPTSSVTNGVSFVLPAAFAEGNFRWLLTADADNSLYERNGEANNQSSAALRVARPDLVVADVHAPTLARSGDRLRVEWTVDNVGASAAGDYWIDSVYLAQDAQTRLLAEVAHTSGLASGARYAAAADFEIPLELDGDYRLVVVTDAARRIDDHQRNDNRADTPVHIDRAPYADLAVTDLSAPAQVIGDPARVAVTWTVANHGQGAGRSSTWSDRLVLSTDAVLGNADDRLLGEYRHDGVLAPGESYTRSAEILLPPGTSQRYQLFAVTDAAREVFENGARGDDIALLAHPLDVMPVPYADLQVEAVGADGPAASGRPLRVNWEVVNRGIGITDSGDWSDQIWLSRNPDGSDVVASLGSARHIGQLAAGDRYRRSIDVTLPDGIAGNYYLNVRTGGPFEFVFGDNDSGHSQSIPVALSPSPDLVVETVTLPPAARAGSLLDVAWTVLNQGQTAATGIWEDSLWLVPAAGGDAVSLGSFRYDRELAAGQRYTRSEQLRLPAKIEGAYRVRVVTNARLGGGGDQVYEYGSARDNNSLTSAELGEISLDDHPDLRVTAVSAPGHVAAGSRVAIAYTVANFGAAASSGHWTDRAYLSTNATLSADDRLIGEFANGSALAPGESYANESTTIELPIRQRGDAWLIVVADAGGQVDEYPNESNNSGATRLTVDAQPFADLVASDVVAPDQAVHGATIEVRYRVSNLGSATTRGETSALDNWTDTIWLARDQRRPGAGKGDVLLGSLTHVGRLGVGEDYLGSAQVTIPDDALSGQYYLSVWSDTYDVIVEDTLASNLNPQDPEQIDNNNYHARAIGILGVTPPDLVVSDVVGQPSATAGGSYRFAYSVQNRGERFSGDWVDSVYLSDSPEWTTAHELWHLGDFAQRRSLDTGETYTVNQTLSLAPAVHGRYLVVRTDAHTQIGETTKTNNVRAVASVVVAEAADLRVTDVRSEAAADSGEETSVQWTVTNVGAAVWSGTRSWVDDVYLGRDPEFVPERATLLGSFLHANVEGLASGGSYSASTRVRLPIGGEGRYYVYVVTDGENNADDMRGHPARRELTTGGDNDSARDDYYARSVYEGAANDNNVGSASLYVHYREPDLQIDRITLSDSMVQSGAPLTVSWTVSNRGSRQTRSASWFDGVYLSRDASLDDGDFALTGGNSSVESLLGVKAIRIGESAQSRFLQPGESYSASATFRLPESVGGDFHLIVRTDTAVGRSAGTASTIRDGLPGLARFGDTAGAVREFRDEGNNEASAALRVLLATPPDLQVAAVEAPANVLAGQTFTVHWQVVNAGGDTPGDQSAWNDLVFLSRDRFLDLRQDHYLGYLAHDGRLAAGERYDAALTVSAPRDLAGPYHVFVITDPTRIGGSGDTGKVREFGNEQNNASAAPQPILVETPPPADLTVSPVFLPADASVGDEVTIGFTIRNDSSNPAYGRWTDAVYLSADNEWDVNDFLLGKVEHVGDLAGNTSYDGTLRVRLPPVKDGEWRVIVRPDLYNEVFEGSIRYTAAGLQLPPGEANNRSASGGTLRVRVPELEVGKPLASTRGPGDERLYKLAVAGGETLRVRLEAAAGSNELYLRYGEVPSGYAYDAAYGDPMAADQQALVASTRSGDYYVLLRGRQGPVNLPIRLRADLLPLSITRITPDHGGSGDDENRWLTVDIHGSHFAAGALVKLSRPGVAESEADRWQVLDATHIRAVFDSRRLPHGLYDVTVINPDGQQVTEAERYLVERGVEPEVTLGIGGPRTLEPGESGIYSVSLQNLGNLDTPYVRFSVGVPEMGYSDEVLEGLALPYLVFGGTAGGQPDGRTVDSAGNTQHYGATPSDGTSRADIPWASLDGVHDDSGWNLAPGYAFDLADGGFVGTSFTLQTYPGLAEWLAYDFPGLRSRLYALHPDWQEQGLLDHGVADLDRLGEGLSRKFLSTVPEEHLGKLEALALPFRFDVAGAATPLTREEFIADQTRHARELRAAILADPAAPPGLAALAADAGQWQEGWLAALEAAGILRPVAEAPPIRENAKVMSLNATLATGILLGKGGDSYRTQSDLLGFFAKVQAWYGDTAQYAGDASAARAPIAYQEVRQIQEGSVEIPVPAMADPARLDFGSSQIARTVDFHLFVGARSELEYLRHVGVLDEDFRPLAGQPLDLGQYLQQAAARDATAVAPVRVRAPQAAPGEDGVAYVPADVSLPYSVSFSNPDETPVGQLRIVSQLDARLDARSFRLADLKIGDINVHLPADRADFQGDFDFTASKGFLLRVSAGIDASTHVATWLLQAIDPDSGEVLHDALHGLLGSAADGNGNEQSSRGFVSYTIRAADDTASGTEITASARLLIDAAPPIDSDPVVVRLDSQAPQTGLQVTALNAAPLASAAPTFDLKWAAADDFSGVRSVTLYVAENGGDFRIWQRQLSPQATEALFTGEPGKHYEFLAVATDHAGNREAATVTAAVLPDDGSRQEVLDSLGATAKLAATAETPLAANDRSYPANALFAEAGRLVPGSVASARGSDLQSVLAPFTLRGFAGGYTSSAADIGAQALVEMPGHSVLASAGRLRNEIHRYEPDSGSLTRSSADPLLTLDSPVLDLAVDASGQLWAMTGAELLQIDAASGTVVRRIAAANGDPLTHALAIDPESGEIYVSSGKGIEIFDPAAADPGQAWRHFSAQRAGDLAFAPDGRLWAVKWTGDDIVGASPDATTEIVSFPMSGRSAGRAELEYRLAGVIDGIAFGATDTPLAGLLFAGSQGGQHPLRAGVDDVPHAGSVWMIELASRRSLQLAGGGTRSETIVTTHDGRVLVAETGRIDEIAPRRPPLVEAVTIPDGALVPLPIHEIGVAFDQEMWTGNGDGSVFDVDNYTLTALRAAASTDGSHPASVRWDAATRTAWLEVSGMKAGEYRLHIASRLQSEAETRLSADFETNFTALDDLSDRLRIDFSRTRAEHATGAVSYDVSITNIGHDDLAGPLMLLLDPGRYFAGTIDGAAAGAGDQSDLWVLDLGSALQTAFPGGKLAAGATLAEQTVSIVPASHFGQRAGMAELIKANLGHGVYAAPQENVAPVLRVADETAADSLPPASVGQSWSADIEAVDVDGDRFYWQLLASPAGMRLTPQGDSGSAADGYHAFATLSWTPSTAANADSEIVVRVEDSRGGSVLRRFPLAVAGGNHAPLLELPGEVTLKEGEALSLPLSATDADGDLLTTAVSKLPAGAVFDASSGELHWTPGYDQAGRWSDITLRASDGKAISTGTFSIVVEPGYVKPVLAPPAPQALREGEHFTLQLVGFVPGAVGNGLQADGSALRLEYGASWLPGGATLDPETGHFSWTPNYVQHGHYAVPLTLTAIRTAADGTVSETSSRQELVIEVANANGAPVFPAAELWNVLEGQPLRVSVMAFDPDNPDFTPKIRLRPEAEAVGPETPAPTVSYRISGLPQGAVFDAETLEIVWTPGYDQAGSYQVVVTATDDGDNADPAVSQWVLPIVVHDARRAPQIGAIANAIVDAGEVIDIPVSASDADGNPVELGVDGLPAFGSFHPLAAADPAHAEGMLHFAPGAGDRGDYTITVDANDDRSPGSQPEAAPTSIETATRTASRSFVLSVRSLTIPPRITAPYQVVAIVGQPLALPLLASDADQDPLHWRADDLPPAATLTPGTQYGHATLSWIPTAEDVGNHEVELIVTDSGLPPQDAGYVNPAQPVPNVTRQNLRVVVRTANVAPTLVGVRVNGETLADHDDGLAIAAAEGVPLAIDFFAGDADGDPIDWQIADQPRGMSVTSDGNGYSLRWTPDAFAAQDGNAGHDLPGHWRFRVSGGDGAAQFTRQIEISVANVNQAPRLLPIPLQLVDEGHTLSFTVRAFDADHDPLQLSLMRDENTPRGVAFNAASGSFEWTPDQDTVDPARSPGPPGADDSRTFAFTFAASDGQALATQTVQVRVFDVDRRPRISVGNHAVRVGDTLSLPVLFARDASDDAVTAAGNGIVLADPDGAAQTRSLTISFANLPAGASFDQQRKRLDWTPGPGQIGDTVVTVRASDGLTSGNASASCNFVLRAVANSEANVPTIFISTTPELPANPGQLVIGSVRADAWSGIASLKVERRGSELDAWQSVALDAAGRFHLTPE
ncbi:MAG: putative Ig domain-containing protein, partial [Candidatus Accumulibacter sp.]|uniref:putative Ig domain-containing protein n=1 Tax=Accumulibacter sp. TaxID=2053492 RepID=UPI0025EE48AF